jgi:zinc protease
VDPGVSAALVRDAAVITDAEQVEANVMLTTVRPEPSTQTVGDFRNAVVERLGRSIFNRRLMTLLQENAVVFTGGGGIDRGEALGGYLLGGVALSAPSDEWQTALTQVVEEIRRFREHGVVGEELVRAKDAMRAEAEQAAATAGDMPGMSVAMALNDAIADGRPPLSLAQAHELAVDLLPGVTAEEVVAAFREQIDPAHTLVLLVLPEKEGVEAPDKDQVLATLKKALATKVEPREARTAVTAILERDPEPGDVTARSHHEKLGVTELVLANGIRVRIKPLPDTDEVHVRVNLMGGLVEEKAGVRGITEAAALAFESGRLSTKNLSPTDISLFLESRQVNVVGGVEGVAVNLSVSGTTEAIPDGLRLAHLLLKEPAVDAAALESWKRELPPKLAQLKVNIPMQGLLTLRSVASGGDVRMALPSMADYEKITLDAAQAWLEHLVREAPMEVVISGGIAVAEGERLARIFFGSLPDRPDRNDEIHALRKVQLVKGPLVKEVGIQTITPVAMVLFGWRGASLDDAPRQIALSHAGTILTTRLLKEVREEKGLAYSIGSGYQFTDFEGLDGILVQFAAAPAKAAEAAKIAKDVALAFAEEGPTQEEITAAERQMVNVLEEQMQSAQFWLAVLGKLHANHRSLEEVQARLDALRTVDREFFAKTLKEILVDERFVQVIVKPAGS